MSSSVAIAYSPQKGLPVSRLSSEIGTQPLSVTARALIKLQTFEGSFRLGTALATTLGVPIEDLED
jgi:hypothetical protein